MKEQDPFQIPNDGKGIKRLAKKAIGRLASRMLQFPELNRHYHEVASMPEELPITTRMLKSLNVQAIYKPEYLAQIPTEGPLIIIANHPFGGIEGIVLADILQKVRPDTKLLANKMLGLIPGFEEIIFPVNVFGGESAKQANQSGLRHAMKWIKEGHCLGLFPAGAVSHMTVKRRTVADPEWQPHIARIIQKTGATVVPVFFEGRNSAAFQLAGLMHPRLRSVMLPKELMRRRGRRLRLRIGRPITPERIAQFKSPESLSDYLRVRTYLLKRNRQQHHLGQSTNKYLPLGDITPRRVVQEAWDALPKEAHLFESGDFQVRAFYGKDSEILMNEIGRQREFTFRKAHEGTGKALDIDIHDMHYVQLMIWDRIKQAVVGGYRIGRTDNILKEHGLEGLYVHKLFELSEPLLQQMGPSLELGRSWVHPDYQRHFAPLMLLWKGIGHYAVKNPNYRRLIGPVSISADYDPTSIKLLTTFLKMHAFLPDLARLIKPRTPVQHNYRAKPYTLKQFSTVVENLDEVNQIISDLEADNKPMPVLLRQYLKLNGQVLGFNLDPDFGNVVDALITIDMLNVDKRIMSKYMGKEGFQSFKDYHANATDKK